MTVDFLKIKSIYRQQVYVYHQQGRLPTAKYIYIDLYLSSLLFFDNTKYTFLLFFCSFKKVKFLGDEEEAVNRANKKYISFRSKHASNPIYPLEKPHQKQIANNRRRMVDPKSGNNESQHGVDNPRKDHYSYTYTYKTADPESGVPGVSSVEVNESVTEEIGPDGSKIIRRHQQEKQINQITQVVTQRVIKRQYIDPMTGQIIEYDPNNELFANLPPETVFEEHTIISDDANATPVVTTTTISKTTPQNTMKWSSVGKPGDKLPLSMQELSLNESAAAANRASAIDTLDNISGGYATLTNQQSASFRIKSHPEDNQGYPEEKNMDYDPDDYNPDDDYPYEGLAPTVSNKNGRGGSGGSTSGGSSSSPAFDNAGIDLPLITTTSQTKHHYQHYATTGSSKSKHYHQIAECLPSPNLGQHSLPHHKQQKHYQQTAQQQQQPQIYQTYSSTHSNKYVVDEQLDPNYAHHPHHHQMQQHVNNYQKNPVSLHSNDYGKFLFFVCVLIEDNRVLLLLLLLLWLN